MWTAVDPAQACNSVISASAGKPYAGLPYEDFLCLYPWMKRYWLQWEIDFYRDDPYWYYHVMNNNHWIPIAACTSYLILVSIGQQYFKNRKPWNCRNVLMVWNLGLAIFSLMGFLRMFPTVIHWLANYTWEENLCHKGVSHVGQNPVLSWILLFTFSKYPELLDTFFIVVHKKKLIFLHWYHHISVLCYAWWTTATFNNAGMFYGTMNFGVHAIMYFYYFLMAANCKPKWFKAKIITVCQIAQMVLGVGITVSGLHFSKRPGCSSTSRNLMAGMIMYGSYLLLFTKFFFDRYFKSKTEVVPKRKKKLV